MKREEQAAHQAIFKYITYAAPHVLCFHVQNNAKSKRTGGIYKSLGVMPGVGDLLLFWDGDTRLNRAIYSLLPKCGALEIKSSKGKQSPAQKLFEMRWTKLGGKYAIVRSVDDTQAILKQWGVI